MYIALGVMITGMILGRILHRPLARLPIGATMFGAVLGLLFILGLQIGANDSLFTRLHELGWQALALTVFALAGTIGAGWLLQRFLARYGKIFHA